MTTVFAGLEVLFVLILLVGVGMWSVPGSLVLAGVLGIVAVERLLARPAPAERKKASG